MKKVRIYFPKILIELFLRSLRTILATYGLLIYASPAINIDRQIHSIDLRHIMDT